MSDDEMRRFPEELGKMGFVFNFITYGGHQIDGLAAEEFATALQAGRHAGPGPAAAQVPPASSRRTGRRRPWSAARGSTRRSLASSGRTATTKAMGKGSTQHQHLIQTEVPKKLLEEWLAIWAEHYGITEPMRVQLRPHRAGSELLELGVVGEGDAKLANVVFAPIQDRRGRSILSVRDQNTFDDALRQKRLMTLIHLFLVHRYKADSVHYVSPTEDNQYQTGEDEGAGHLHRGQHRGRPDHRRRRQRAAHRGIAAPRPHSAREVDSQGTVPDWPSGRRRFGQASHAHLQHALASASTMSTLRSPMSNARPQPARDRCGRAAGPRRSRIPRVRFSLEALGQFVNARRGVDEEAAIRFTTNGSASTSSSSRISPRVPRAGPRGRRSRRAAVFVDHDGRLDPVALELLAAVRPPAWSRARNRRRDQRGDRRVPSRSSA